MRDKKKIDWNNCHLPQQPNDFNQKPPTWNDCRTPWIYEDGKLVAAKRKEEEHVASDT